MVPILDQILILSKIIDKINVSKLMDLWSDIDQWVSTNGQNYQTVYEPFLVISGEFFVVFRNFRETLDPTGHSYFK